VATTIKVDRLVLLDALTKKLAEQDKFRADYKKAEEKYQKATEAFASKIITLVKAGKLEITDTNYRTWRDDLEITIKVDKAVMPAQPENPKTPDGWLHDSDYNELSKTIKLLQMTTDQSVPASLYKSVAQWL
jgi:predicted ribosome quality control (RQC) complex YloA/Tae2 family protein